MNTQVQLPLGLLASAALAACGSSPMDITMPPDAGSSPGRDAGANSAVDAGSNGGVDAGTVNALCPPGTDNVGIAVGQVIPNLELLECDGTPVGLHDFCDKTATYFFVYADW